MMYYLAKNAYTFATIKMTTDLIGDSGFNAYYSYEDFVTIKANNKAEAEKMAKKYFDKKDYCKKPHYSGTIVVYDTITEHYFADEEQTNES
jgi:hypothetical protein